MSCFACIHCHFYQPPRENPWLETVEAQDSASPFHDWNERIARECYIPNGASRILDSQGRIARIVNNYARISFNFGPTLLSWIEAKAPECYQRILDGDRESQRRFSGHGGALAQAYNHTILPLANARDKRTQILWGIRDFQRRFKRDPEGMWLPETAVDLGTLDILAAEGIKFTILAPRQVEQLRIDPESPWIEPEYGIDSRRAYRCELPSGRTIGLFFHDGALATAVAFEKLLYSGENFARRLLMRFDPEGDSAQLMHVATDGETYGHHHAHGDMALAYALQYIEEKKLARITNYGEFLELNPPEHEIRIKENTSWSCAHDVGRWKENCGCNAGSRANWNQSWRGPLRKALDWLRDELNSKYELAAAELFEDPWLARDEYVNAVLDRSEANVARFLQTHSTRELTSWEEVRALRLMELQRHLMLMYTSCGWFFDEPTGPETVQILQYAARAVQLGEQLFESGLEERFLQNLELIHSNIPEFGNGRSIYERFVRPAMLDLPGVGAHYAIRCFFDGYDQSDSIYSYHARLREVKTFKTVNVRLALGTVEIESRVTHARLDFDFAVAHAGGQRLEAGVCEASEKFSQFAEEIQRHLSSFDASIDLLERYFGSATYSLKSLFRDERQRIVGWIVDSALSDVDKLYGEVYEHNTALIGFLSELRMPLPPILRVSSEFVLNNTIRRALTAEHLDIAQVRLLIERAKTEGITFDALLKSALCSHLNSAMDRWVMDPFDMQSMLHLEPLISLLRDDALEADLWTAQNKFYELMMTIAGSRHNRASKTWLSHFENIGALLGVAVPRSNSAAGEDTDLRFAIRGAPTDYAQYAEIPSAP